MSIVVIINYTYGIEKIDKKLAFPKTQDFKNNLD